MKIFKIVVFLLFGCFLSSLSAQTIAIGRINTEVLAALNVTETEQIGFGRFVTATDGGFVELSPEGDRATRGFIQLIEGSYGAGKFLISGVPGNLVTVTMPQRVDIFSNGGYSMTVTDFRTNLPAGGKMVDLTTGKMEVSVGATLRVGNNITNPTGFYSGIYDIVFMYN